MRIDKFLSNMGFGSRKEIKQHIKNKKVFLNGILVKNSDVYVDVENDDVYFFNQKVVFQKYVYIIMNKPSGYISANKDNKYKTVFDLLDNSYKKNELFVAGRLDKDTEGMLIITNNGIFAHNMLSPKKHVLKKYFVVLQGSEITDDDIKLFSDGVTINNNKKLYKCKPAFLEIIENGQISKCFITISEGKFHQVKKMFSAIGQVVTYLKRVKIGQLELDNNINVGEYRELTDYEISLIGVDME